MLQQKIGGTKCPTKVAISSDIGKFGRPLSDDRQLFAALDSHCYLL